MRFFFLVCFLFLFNHIHAQMITGVWKGRVGTGIKSQKVELKIIQKGDSLTGTAYYYESPNNYRRYAIKGYFNQQNNTVVWWDDELLEEKNSKVRLLSPGEIPLLAEADFNCPGGGIMMLDGKAVSKEEQKEKGPLHFEKVTQPVFKDGWDEIIENYTVGGNDPDWITEVDHQQRQKQQAPPQVIVSAPPPKPQTENKPSPEPKKEEPVVISTPPPVKKDTTPVIIKTETQPVIPKQQPQPVVITNAPTIQEKFTERKKVLTTEFPLEGDTIEIHFYDNAEIDGDSISLFMNNQLVFEHVRLSDKPYIVKFAVKDLGENNELVMVAENLGSIPPNTSYMITYINGERYTANLESTEKSSAMIRFRKKGM